VSRIDLAAAAALAALALASCRGGDAKPGVAVTDEAAWRKALLEHRASTDATMRSPTSPLAALEYHILPPGAPTYARLDGDAVRLSQAPTDDAAVAFRPSPPDGWRWEALAAGVTATLGDGSQAVAPGPVRQPTRIALGRYLLWAQDFPRGFVLMIYDPGAEALRQFTGVPYFEPDLRYAVSATLERFSDPAVIKLPTSIGLTRSFLRYGTLRFTIDGTPAQLTAYQPEGDPHALFVPFRDATSGTSTYGAGRYLDLEEAPAAGERAIVVDFNRAYSPMCNFSPAFNCPIPPVENHLKVAIEAGQKTYSH